MTKRENKHIETMIDDIIENFDFQKCRDVMTFLNWTWFRYEDIPSVDQLKESARDRILSAIEIATKNRCNKATYFSSSGGLKANVWVNKFGHVEGLRLEFVLTDWDCDGDA